MVERPREIVSCFGNNALIASEFYLTSPNETKGQAPISMHAGNLSRFVMTMINLSEGAKTVLTANIPAKDISSIKEMTLRAGICLDRYQERIGESSAATGSSPAYRTKMALKPFKDRTPADILTENPSDKEKLLETKAYLEKYVDTYPGNKPQIEAIEDAVRLLNEGKLVKTGVTAAPSGPTGKVVYFKEYKHKKPWVGDKRTIYSIRIECDFTSTNYPWKITIANWLAPMKKGPGGQPIPEMSAATDKKVGTIRLSDTDWIEFVDQMYRLIGSFENYSFPNALSRTEALAWSPENAAGEGAAPAPAGSTT